MGMESFYINVTLQGNDIKTNFLDFLLESKNY